MRKFQSSTYLIVALVLGAFLVGFLIGERRPDTHIGFLQGVSADTPPEDVDYGPVWKTWHELDDNFVPTASSTRVSSQERIWGMIEGLAKSYNDPYTVFLPPQEASMFEEDISGSFGGVGMEVGERDGIITVISPLKDTPAEQAGIHAGDKIIEIDGKTTQDVSVDEAVRRIRGEVGSKVSFTIAREGAQELLHITVVRDTIKIPTINATMRQDGIFDLELYNFGATSPSEFRRGLKQFLESGSDKLIIDLRGNPGGFLEAATDIASWFLPMGSVVVSEDFGKKESPNVHRSKGYNVVGKNVNVVVLINEGSASASEILAGALSDHKVATLIGSQSFGKGSVQELKKITPDSSLKVTIARWLTPSGKSISITGLTPDIKIPRTTEDYTAGRDPQLDAAVKFLKGESAQQIIKEAAQTASSTSKR